MVGTRGSDRKIGSSRISLSCQSCLSVLPHRSKTVYLQGESFHLSGECGRAKGQNAQGQHRDKNYKKVVVVMEGSGGVLESGGDKG